MRVGILYVATGKYITFFEPFYYNAKKNLLKDCDVTFYVFTDSERVILAEQNNDIKIVKTSAQGWPYSTLMRYHCFNKIRDDLIRDNDYLLFLNANTIVSGDCSHRDIFGNKDFVCAIHPYYFNIDTYKDLPFENNSNSTAFLGCEDKEFHYFGGGFIGGKSEELFECVFDPIIKGIDKDLDDGVIAKWHDESHLNKLLNTIDISRFNVLSPKYFYPVELFRTRRLSQFEPAKILILDKNIIAPKNFIRDISDDYKLGIQYNDLLCMEIIPLYDQSINAIDRLKVYKDDVWASIRMRKGLITSRTDNEIDIIWDNGGLCKYCKNKNGYYEEKSFSVGMF